MIKNNKILTLFFALTSFFMVIDNFAMMTENQVRKLTEYNLNLTKNGNKEIYTQSEYKQVKAFPPQDSKNILGNHATVRVEVPVVNSKRFDIRNSTINALQRGAMGSAFGAGTYLYCSNGSISSKRLAISASVGFVGGVFGSFAYDVGKYLTRQYDGSNFTPNTYADKELVDKA